MPDDAQDFIDRLVERYNGYGGNRDPLRLSGVPASPPVSSELMAALHGPYEAAMQQARGLQAGAMHADPVELAMGLLGPKVPFPARISNPIRAYHGSPHDFDKFDLAKIGTGEGAQAYGRGLYFAENQDVAKAYREALAPMGQDRLRIGGNAMDIEDPLHHLAATLHETGGDRAWALRTLKDTHYPDSPRANAAIQNAIRHLEGSELPHLPPITEMPAQGRMYEVALHATPEQFLDWDKPLSGQSEAIKRGLEPFRAAVERDWQGQVVAGTNNLQSGHALSESLREAGIPGIRYLDQGSRGNGQGTSNYVVWTPEIIEILRKYGILGPAALGAASNALTPDKALQQ